MLYDGCDVGNGDGFVLTPPNVGLLVMGIRDGLLVGTLVGRLEEGLVVGCPVGDTSGW